MRESGLKAGKGARRLLAAAALLLACSSCTQLELVPVSEVDAHQLIGERVRVLTHEGEVLDFRLREVTNDALVGESQSVSFEDVAMMQQRKFSAAVLVGSVVGGVLGVVVLYCIYWAISGWWAG